MTNHGWFSQSSSWHLHIALLAAAAFGLLYASSVAAESGSTFDRLEALDRERAAHERLTERAAYLLERSAPDDRTLPTERVPQRVRQRLADRAGRRLAGWSALRRAATRRGLLWRPGRGADLRRLLTFAEHASLDEGEAIYRALDRIRERRSPPGPSAIWRRAQTTVELAQHRARSGATVAEKDGVVERAKRDEPSELERELDESQERLESTLRRLLNHETGEDFHRKKGTLLPPVSAEIAQGFGKAKQDDSYTFVRHTGLTYRVEPGTDVRATADGLVVHARRFQGYGNLVIIDHGDGYHSLYAHLREIDVDEGDEVGRGARLGGSGSTDSLDGPKLYFELRHDEQPIDPKPWFLRKEE